MHIVFVCTGNTCRSPMAEALLKAKIKEQQFGEHITVSSAGIAAWFPGEASPQAQAVMEKQGLTLKDHRSSRLMAGDIARADLVLTMTRGHKEAVLSLVPDAQDKVYTLSEFAGERGDIPDPYGGDFAIYWGCAKEIEKILGNCWVKIQALAGEKGVNSEN